MFDRYIQAVPTLTDELREDIIKWAIQDRDWYQSGTVNRDGTSSTSEYRTCSEIPLLNYPRRQEMLDAFNKAVSNYTTLLCNEIPAEFLHMPMVTSPDTYSYMDEPVLLCYQKGQEYYWHHDQSDIEGLRTSGRSTSMVLYLNDSFEGGGTEFIDGVRKPDPGEALFFPSCWTFRHRAQRVTKGVKLAIVTWYYVKPNPPVQQPEPSVSESPAQPLPEQCLTQVA
nr:prolyl hydroxylase alpha subunit homolog [uncultured Mediterranean phage uvMED]